MSSSSGVNLEKYLIPLDEIKRATENFSCKIGGGGFGSVYKGTLSERWENRTVAVKRLDPDSRQGWHEFRNEIELISKFQHENIIAFIGYCDEGGEMIIVYEYASNGSLDDHLRDPTKMSCITWAQRLKICIGAARGLHYLHSGLGGQDRVIHRDVKSANILLDGNMVAKICDFGLSKAHRHQQHTRPYTKVAGTEFYLDPAYRESGNLQNESDIYSLGVVLFEVVSGMLVYHERSIGDERQSLMSRVRRYHPMELHKLIDPYIRDQIKFLSFYSFDEIAYKCLNLNLENRPSLENVVKKLEEASKIQISEQYSDSNRATPSEIKGLLGMLNSVNPYDQGMASGEIHLLTEYFDLRSHGFGFSEDWAIPALTQLLIKAPDSETQEHALTALLNLSTMTHYGKILVSSGSVPKIADILKKGSNEAREKAAAAIYNLSQINDEAVDTCGSAGAIPPLVLLLSEGSTTTKGKRNAAYALFYLCITHIDNQGRAVAAGLVPTLLELLLEPADELKETSAILLAKLVRHPEGKFGIAEAKVVPHLVEVIGSGCTWYVDEVALTLLDELCSMDQKYLVEAQEHGVMRKLKGLRRYLYGTDEGKRRARQLRRNIKDHQNANSRLVAIGKRICLISDKITKHSCIS